MKLPRRPAPDLNLFAIPITLSLLASCMDDGPPARAAATHQGTISIQDRTLHGLPQAGHGLSVLIEFTAAWRPPDFEDMPGSPAGCKVWLFDAATDPRPALLGDAGRVTIDGTSGPIPNGCSHEPAAGYLCPAVAGAGPATLRPAGADAAPGTALFEVGEPRFGPDDRGRYLGLVSPPDGAYPIVRVLSPTALLVLKSDVTGDRSFPASYRTLAGVGTAPGLPHQAAGDPLLDGDRVVVGLQPAGGSWFQFAPTAAIAAGGAFTLDEASQRTLSAIPVDGRGFALGCGGAGGTCAAAEVSILRILTTDGDVAGLSPFAMPAAASKQVEISCAEVEGDGVVDVSPAVSRYLQAAHQARPITRIRTAFMRNGYALVANPPPLPPSRVTIAVGHQLLAFGSP